MNLHDLIFELEAVGDAAGDAGAALSPDPAAGTAGAAGEGTASAPATAPAPAWSADDPAFLDAVDARAAELFQTQMGPIMPLLESLFVGDQQQPAAADLAAAGVLDLLDPNFGSSLDARFQTLEQRLGQMLDRVAQPLAQRDHADRVAGNQQLVDQAVAADVERHGELPAAAKALIDPLGVQLLPEFEARYGQGSPRALEATVARTTSIIRELVTEAKKLGADEYKETLGNVAGARSEPGSAGVGGAQGVADGASPSEITRRFAERARGLRVA